MKRDHFGFALFLMLLLIAPEAKFHLRVLPISVSVCPGFFGLIVWALLSPGYLIRLKGLKSLTIPLTLVFFGLYILAVSLLSTNPISIAYAGQYLFYMLAGFLLLSGYFKRAIQMNQLNTALAIFQVVGLIFASGVIVSKWTGPIYPSQYERGNPGLTWTTQRSIGFGSNPNSVGAVLVVFSAFSLFGPMKKFRGMRWLFFSICFTALMLTLSRKSAIAFSSAVFILTLLKSLKLIVTKKSSDNFVPIFWLTLCLAAFTISAISILVPEHQERNLSFISPILERYQMGDDSSYTLNMAFAGRMRFWNRAMVAWWDRSSYMDLLFGRGFLGSQILVDTGWGTAHNAYIDILGDFGLIGILLFVLPLLYQALSLAFRVLKKEPTSLFSFSFVALLSLLIQNVGGSFYYSPIIMSLTLMVVILSSLNLSSSWIESPWANRFSSRI